MRNLLILIGCLLAVTSFAQSPAYRNFNSTQFGSNSYILSFRSNAATTNTVLKTPRFTAINGTDTILGQTLAGASGTVLRFTDPNNVLWPAITLSDTGLVAATIFGTAINGTTFTGSGSGLTSIPPTTGIAGWPANAVGVLKNNGGGVLSWGAGGSGDTNGISYVPDGTTIFPAVRTRTASPTGYEILEMLWTNGTPAIGITNNSGGSSTVTMKTYDGFPFLRVQEAGFLALDTDGGQMLLFVNGNDGIELNLSTRRYHYPNEVSAITLTDAGGTVIISPDTTKTLTVSDSGVSIVGGLTMDSLNITGNVTVNGTVIGNAAGLTNFLYVPNTTTLFNTNAAILTNCVNYLVVTNNVRFTNWAAIAVSGQWFQVAMTNSTAVNYYVDVPTNGFTRALTNATGSYVVADASGTNFACLLTNGQRAVLSGKFVGGNLNAGYFQFRHW